jgi:hypothetical protein
VIRDSWKNGVDSQRLPSPHEKSPSPATHGSPSFSSRGLHPVGVSSTMLASSRLSIRSRRSAGTPRTDTDLSSDAYTSSESEEVGELSLSRGMKRLTIRGLEPEHGLSTDGQVRFHGKSSCFKLIEPTRKLREEHMNRVIQGAHSPDGESRSSPESTSSVSFTPIRRSEFWTTPPVSVYSYLTLTYSSLLPVGTYFRMFSG